MENIFVKNRFGNRDRKFSNQFYLMKLKLYFLYFIIQFAVNMSLFLVFQQ